MLIKILFVREKSLLEMLRKNVVNWSEKIYGTIILHILKQTQPIHEIHLKDTNIEVVVCNNDY